MGPRAPALASARRCRMHGGAPGSGGPKGSRNGNYERGPVHGRSDRLIARQFLEYVLQRLTNQRVIVDQKKLHAMRRAVSAVAAIVL
jgi:hypothetical protein